ncbi:MAG: Ig-like domain-containing protein [Candidatus Nanopelagicales bacterium]
MSNRAASPFLVTALPSRKAKWIAGFVTFALVLLSAALVIPNAHAAPVITFQPSNATVGVSVPLHATMADANASLKAGSLAYFTNPGTLIGTAAISDTGSSDPVAWVPATAGSVGLYAVYSSTDGSQTVTSPAATVSIAKAATTTVVSAPAMAKISTAVDFTATVKTTGKYVPTGTVTFQKGDGTPIETKALSATGTATTSILMPATQQTFTIKAVYQPDANSLGSESAVVTTAVTTSGSNIALTAPSAGTPGTAISLSAQVSPISGTGTATGTVTFYVGTTVIDVKPLASGAASTTWTPTSAGTFTLKANYSSNGVTVDGTASQSITVGQPAQTDRIILTPTTTSASWIPGAGYVLRNGSSVTLNARSTSGLTVSLAATGTCAVSGYTITARAGSGTCAVTAATQGNASYAPTTQRNTIALAAGYQTIAAKAPRSGRVAFGRWYRLADPGLVTSIGSSVSWYVTSGTSRCTIRSTPLGAVVFKFKRHGYCTIAARAAGVPQTWLSLNKYFDYRA